MEGSGPGFPFGGDPEDLMRSLREFAEQQAETVQEAQREQFATLTLNTAVELTSAALAQVEASGSVEEQAAALRDALRDDFHHPRMGGSVAAAGAYFLVKDWQDLIPSRRNTCRWRPLLHRRTGLSLIRPERGRPEADPKGSGQPSAAG